MPRTTSRSAVEARPGFARHVAATAANGRTARDRADDVRRNWPALLAAFDAGFGTVRDSDTSPAAALRRRLLVDFVWRYCIIGEAELAAWCHRRRVHATGGRARERYGRGVTSLAAFVASGLDRAWRREASEAELADGRAQALDRLAGPHETVRPAHVERLEHFVAHVAARASHGQPAALPEAASTATRQSGRRAGGQVADVAGWQKADGLRRFRVHVAAAVAVAVAHDRRLRRAAETAPLRLGHQPTPAEAADLPPPPPGLTPEQLRYWNSLPVETTTIRAARRGGGRRARAAALRADPAAMRRAAARQWRDDVVNATPGGRVGPGLRACGFLGVRWPAQTDPLASPLAVAYEACRRAVARRDAGEPSVARVCTFANANGKLRVATVHDADVVLAARAVTRFLLARLRCIRTNKANLRNELVRLQPAGPGAVAYSADLSKATDRIGVPLARHVLVTALEAAGAPRWLVDAALPTTGDMVIEGDGRQIDCGALMGLGPSWVILSLLNDFAATRAGAPANSFAVNGDDLLGYWPPEMADRYERELRLLGLVPNTAKSFRGSGGIFCECFARVEKGLLVARPVFRLGEASGAKAIEGRRGHLVADDLRNVAHGSRRDGWHPTPRAVRALARGTLAAVALRAPGPQRLGGGGRGLLDAIGAASFIAGGPTSTRTRQPTEAERADSLRRRELLAGMAERARDGDGTGPRLAEIAADLAADGVQRLRAAGAWRDMARAKPAQRRDHARRLECRRVYASRIGPFEALRAADARLRWTARVRAIAHEHFRRRRWQAGAAYLATHTRRVAEAVPVLPLYPPGTRKLFAGRSPTWGPGPTAL